MQKESNTERPATNGELERVRAASRGEAKACHWLVETYGPGLMRLIAGLVCQKEEAEEVLQDALYKALSHLDTFDPAGASMQTWLRRIAYNTAVSHLRRKGKLPVVYLEDIEMPDAGEEAELDAFFSTGRPQRVSSLERVLAALPHEERSLLTMRYVDEMGLEEMAYILDTSPAALSSRLYRIRKKIKNQLSGANGMVTGR